MALDGYVNAPLTVKIKMASALPVGAGHNVAFTGPQADPGDVSMPVTQLSFDSTNWNVEQDLVITAHRIGTIPINYRITSGYTARQKNRSFNLSIAPAGPASIEGSVTGVVTGSTYGDGAFVSCPGAQVSPAYTCLVNFTSPTHYRIKKNGVVISSGISSTTGIVTSITGIGYYQVFIYASAVVSADSVPSTFDDALVSLSVSDDFNGSMGVVDSSVLDVPALEIKWFGDYYGGSPEALANTPVSNLSMPGFGSAENTVNFFSREKGISSKVLVWTPGAGGSIGGSFSGVDWDAPIESCTDLVYTFSRALTALSSGSANFILSGAMTLDTAASMINGVAVPGGSVTIGANCRVVGS